ncbi:MAG: prepilin-type N-terminal cleavage/methylation domain-containing protein [Candidatus Saganbacteria bacterium]|nr:prepilin-type N-terminal cleavage/methylation domain-containing protein [Candidatus Saganbacteria bacterium]
MRHNKSGFTLIELIIVISILGFVAVATFASLAPSLPMRIQMARKKIRTDIRYTQSLAESTQKRTQILFSNLSDSYTVYIENTYGANDWVVAKDPNSRGDFSVELNTGQYAGVAIEAVYFNAANQALVFDKWGNPYGYNVASEVATQLTEPAGVALVGNNNLQVEKATGKVYLSEGPVIP